MNKSRTPPTYEQALTWVNDEYRKSLSSGKTSKELLVAQALIIKIHKLEAQLQTPVDKVIEHK